MAARFEKWNGTFNFMSCVANLTVAACAVLSVYFLFTQTPLFMGNRPQLAYWISRSNSNTADNDGLYWTQAEVTIANTSQYPARDVYVVMGAIGDGTNWICTCKHHCEEISQPDSMQKATLIRTVPSNSEVKLVFKQRIPQYRLIPDTPNKFNWERQSFFADPDDFHNFSGSEVEYFAEVRNIYYEFGAAVEWKHKSESKRTIIPADWRSDESKAKNAELRKAKREEDRKAGKPLNWRA